MQAAERRRAVAAAMSTASAAGLTVDDAVVLNDSNRLVVRLTPCDIVARVTPVTHYAGHHMSAEREVELVKWLAQTGSPVATLDVRVEPRVFARDSFTISMWTYFDTGNSRMLAPADYVQALERLHSGLRQIDLMPPHVMDRVAAVQHDVASRDITPDLTETDRAFLASTLRDLKKSIMNHRQPEQLLHGEPHPGNVLSTKNGPLFIDFENTAYGPVEYDLAWAPKAVSDRYRGADQDLVGECRGLILALIAAYRWRRDDHHPSGRQSGMAFLSLLREGPPWPAVA
jgi:aminoglycoside phosphotransferase (APT) family kinase protein